MKQVRWVRFENQTVSTAYGEVSKFTLEYNDGSGWKDYTVCPLKKIAKSSVPGENPAYPTMQVLLRAGYQMVEAVSR